MSESAFAFDVFVSHNSDERIAVAELCERLRDEGKLRPWRDQDSIQPGAEWERSIRTALASCPCCAVLFGPQGWGRYHFLEAALAFRGLGERPGFRVIPVLLPGALESDFDKAPTENEEEVKALAGLKSLQWIDFRKGLDADEAFLKLMAAIQGRELSAEDLPAFSPYRVNKDARTWQKNERSPRYLYSGGQLEDAQRLAKREPEALTDLAVEFLKTGAARALRNRRLTRAGFGGALAAALAVYFVIQFVADTGYSQEIAANNLPAGIYRAPSLESLIVTTPLARLDWIRPPLKHLEIVLNEDGTPNTFPKFLTELTITGQGDGRSVRYDVDAAQLPPGLTSLSLKSVSLRNPKKLGSLQHLKALSLREIYIGRGSFLELPPNLESLETDDSAVGPEDIQALKSLKSLTGPGFRDLDIRILPASLRSLSVSTVKNPEALASLQLRELHTGNLDILASLPKSVRALFLSPQTLDAQKLALLHDTAIEKLDVNLPEPPDMDLPAPPAVLRRATFDVAWLPPSVQELSLHGVNSTHDEQLKNLTKLTKVSLESAGLDITPLPNLQDLSMTSCLDAPELKDLPAGLRRLSLACLSQFSKAVRNLRRFASIEGFTGLELSDDINFRGLPAALKQLAVGSTSGDASTVAQLPKLTELSLDFTPGTGGSDVPGRVDENLTIIDVKDLPRSLTKLQLTNLTLYNAPDLAKLDGLLELTVDHYNRGTAGIPKTLKKLVIKGEVNAAEFRKMTGFRE